jgi:hypothetical protein
VHAAFQNRAKAEQDLIDAVSSARSDGHSPMVIATMLGTSGEAARQRYGAGARSAATGP